MPILDNCIANIYTPGNIGASSGQTPVQPTVPSLFNNYGVGFARGVGAASGVAVVPTGTATGVGTASGVGAVGGLLDAYTTGLTGAWSFSRNLLTAFGSAKYTDTAGAVDTLVDQSGGGHTLSAGTTARPTLTTSGPNSRACADFNGTTNTLRTTGGSGQQMTNLIANNNGWMVVSFVADVIDANSGTVYSNEGLMADSGGFCGLYLKTGDAIHVYNYDGTIDTTSTAVTEGTLYVAEWRHEGGTVYCRLNGGTEVSVASGNTSGLAGRFCIGSTAVSPSGPTEFDGKIFEVITYNTTPAVGDRNIIVANMKTWIGA